MSDYFPPEVIHEILLRLPVRCLIKLRAVCRSWNTLIKSPAFIDTHFRRKIPSDLLLLHAVRNENSGGEFYALHKPETSEFANLMNPCLLVEPLLNLSIRFDVIGTCNGLICLSEKLGRDGIERTIVWNPCIRKFSLLPWPNSTYTSDDIIAYAFGYVPSSNDYRVMRFKNSILDESIYLETCEVEIYSIARNCWMTLSDAVVPTNFSGLGDYVCLNGSLHWFTVYDGDEERRDKFITSFDMSSEQFCETLVPQALTTRHHRTHFAKYGESLAVFVVPGLQVYGNGSVVDIWVVKEYGVMESWTKLISINVTGLDRSTLKPFGFRINGEILLDLGGRLHSLNPKSHQAKTIGRDGVLWHKFVDSYVESLVLPGANAISY